ncbi:MLP-like protein 43 [Euphorbia lathyris]|uniref:Major latex protein n=1 Tax=Euphorbia lathyris TaxID=212925 RepID=V9LY34_EUPLT|nr:major latex protein [Euphorbia lathyris]AGC94750.1 putative major latex protein [Euphorbia lathyris]
MSSVEKVEINVEIKSPADKFHDVFSCRPHHVNTMSPDTVHACDLHEGDFGKQGTVVCWSYTHDGEKKIAKELVEEIDDVNNSTTFKVIEGDLLKDYKFFRFIVKATPKGEGGSVVNWTLEYEKMNPQTSPPHTLLDFLAQCTRDIDSHLVAQLQIN